MTKKHVTPTIDEASCCVAPLAREYARCLRADQKLLDGDSDAKAFVEATTMAEHELGPTPEHARGLLRKRMDTLQQLARLRGAKSRFGLAFQLLLTHNDDLQGHVSGDVWSRCPQEARELSIRLDGERQGIIWTAYRTLTAGIVDADLSTLEEWLGSASLTDQESADRILQAVA